LSKEEEIEIDFAGDIGRTSSVKGMGDIVRFEKDGKNYDIIVKIDRVEKGWFRDTVVECSFDILPSSSFDTFVENVRETGNSWFGTGNKRRIDSIQWRWKGPIIVAIIIIFLIIGLIISLWKKRRKF